MHVNCLILFFFSFKFVIIIRVGIYSSSICLVFLVSVFFVFMQLFVFNFVKKNIL